MELKMETQIKNKDEKYMPLLRVVDELIEKIKEKRQENKNAK